MFRQHKICVFGEKLFLVDKNLEYGSQILYLFTKYIYITQIKNIILKFEKFR